MIGASIKTYLLEKTRLIHQAEGERNYHIFYELINGLQNSSPEKKNFGLKNLGVDDFRITGMSGTNDRRDGVRDADTYRDLRNAMDTVAFTKKEQSEILSVASGLLHMSNLDFYETHDDVSALDESNKNLEFVLKLFGVDFKTLNDAICTCTITVGNEVMKKHLNHDKAKKALEALMKSTYGALFDYIVKKVNTSITVENKSGGIDGGNYGHDVTSAACCDDYAFIKILDIFGFESFENNSFEQLCINYCNEALQQQFNKYVFKLEQREYEREGIEWSFISFPDNQDVLDLIEKKHSGLFSLLDEQCKLAKCTDQSFASILYEKCVDNCRFEMNSGQQVSGHFTLHHYAGAVDYSTHSFLDKNKDELPKEATEFLLSSKSSLFQTLGHILNENVGIGSLGSCANASSTMNHSRSSISRASVGSQFAVQLRELRERIDVTTPHYIRCLKSNDKLVPYEFVPSIIADQLRSGGVLEAVRVSRVGFPQRYLHDVFLRRYSILGVKELEKARRTRQNDMCEVLVNAVVPQIRDKQNNTRENKKRITIQNRLKQGYEHLFLI